MTSETEFYRSRWQGRRIQPIFGECGDFFRRQDMRLMAQWYAIARGWTVKLTPPQRSHR